MPPDLCVEDDDEVVDLPVRRVIVAAAGQPLPCTVAPASVWAAAATASAAMKAHGRFGDAAGFEVATGPSSTPAEQTAWSHVVATADRVQVQGARYPSGRWTAERAERERLRRAKQKLPRPPRQQFKLKKSRAFADEKPNGRSK